MTSVVLDVARERQLVWTRQCGPVPGLATSCFFFPHHRTVCFEMKWLYMLAYATVLKPIARINHRPRAPTRVYPNLPNDFSHRPSYFIGLPRI